jgi:serine-type D-Ala-D-Ala carboxypeptidase (penicillin-binding protein 5/6)
VTLSRRRWGALAAFATAALALLPAQALAAPAHPPRINVRAAALIDAGTGQQLYGLHAGDELAIASTTKLMTALVVLQHARLGRVFTAPPLELAAEDSQIGLGAGQKMTVGDLITAMMLPSADDAAYDLAYNVGGHSVGRFVGMMNAEATRLGLSHTHYSTPVGLDTPGNHSTADNLVALAQYVLRTQPFFRHVVGLPSARIRVSGRPRIVTNLNTLVGRVPWVNGVKTGHTLDAGYVLVGSGHRDGMSLISAVLGATSESAREQDTLTLLKWGFDNFRPVSAVTAGHAVASRPVKGRDGLRVALIAENSFKRVLPRSAHVTTVVRAPRELRGPLRKGAVAGTILVNEGRVTLDTIPLRLARAVPAPPASLSPTTIAGPFTLVLLVLVLGVAVVRGRRERLTGRRAASQQQE